MYTIYYMSSVYTFIKQVKGLLIVKNVHLQVVVHVSYKPKQKRRMNITEKKIFLMLLILDLQL